MLWLGGQGWSLVQSGWRVMAVRAGFQCRAAGWHSDVDNDVLVSHRITEQTRSQPSGSGQAGRANRGADCTRWGTKSPKAQALVFLWLIGAPAQCGKDMMKSDLLIFQVFSRGRYISPGEHLIQLGLQERQTSVSVRPFTSLKVRRKMKARTF